MEVRIIIDGGALLPNTEVAFEDKEYVIGEDPKRTLGGLLESATAQIKRAYGITDEQAKRSAYGPRPIKDSPQA